MTKKTILTKEGYEKLKTEYDDLVNVKRPKVVESLQATRSMGDLSENGGYQAAREDQSFIERRIDELNGILKTARVVEGKAKKTSEISVGSRVTLRNLSDKSNVTYYIVGSSEADPANGKISYESPIGNSMVGKKTGEEIIVNTPGGDIKYKVLKIE